MESALSVLDITFSYSGNAGPGRAERTPQERSNPPSSVPTGRRLAALDNASLAVERGQFVALLGANGAGKSTLISIITGLYAAGSGSVHILGHDLRRATSAALSAIGVVFQKPSLDKDLTVAQNLAYAGALHGINRRALAGRVDTLVQQQGIADLQPRKVGQLSGGQQRRVELARALLHQPALLLLDEPTVGLDYRSRLDFLAQVRKLCTQQQVGVLWTTHLLDEIEQDDKVYILRRGNIVASGIARVLAADAGVDDVASLFRFHSEHSEHNQHSEPAGAALPAAATSRTGEASP